MEKAWGSKVTLRNFAIAGWTSGNGVADVAKVAAEKPDLVVIAYGMNDSNVKAFAANIKTLMEKVRETSPNAEFVLVSPMLRSPQQSFDGFRDELAKLCGTGAVLADMTSVWGEMFKRKSFHDLTGNGINHPNDFGHRLYAQVILALLVKPAQ
jgi:lysophospholipase L1-like esterase